MASNSPTKLFGQLQTKEQDAQLSETTNDQRLLVLRDVGSASSTPDRMKCILSCSSTKNTAEDAKSSTNRRVDYIKQTLRNHSVSEKQYTIHSLLSTSPIPDSNENKFIMSAEVCVIFHDTDTYEKVISFLVEKLESSVRVSEAVFYVSPEKISDLRRQACLNAVRNCRTKALSIAQYLNQTLGPAITVREEKTSETIGNSTSHEPNTHLSDKQSFYHVTHSIQQKMADGTVNVSVNIFMEFECKERSRKSNHLR